MSGYARHVGLKLDHLVVGSRYRVTFDDCCLGGHFTDTLVDIEYNEEGGLDALVFTGATMGPGWAFGHAWRVEPAHEAGAA